MKKIIKKIGKSLFVLTHREKEFFRHSVLVVDNGYSSYEYIRNLSRQLKESRPGSEISVLTFECRRAVFCECLPEARIIVPDRDILIKRYQLAFQLLRLRKSGVDTIILPSLDISVLIVSLAVFNSKVVLYNQWRQWWSLRLKNISEIFKNTYISKEKPGSLKKLLKRVGLFYVFLELKDKNILKSPVLFVDNGYASLEHIICTVNRINEAVPHAYISILGLNQRAGFKERAPEVEFIQAEECITEKYRLARHMLRIKNKEYDYVVLLSLDITPLAASMLFKNSRVVLHNQWFQWWSIEPKPLEEHLMIFPRIIYNGAMFAYLFVAVCLLFLRKSFNVFSLSLARKKG